MSPLHSCRISHLSPSRSCQHGTAVRLKLPVCPLEAPALSTAPALGALAAPVTARSYRSRRSLAVGTSAAPTYMCQRSLSALAQVRRLPLGKVRMSQGFKRSHVPCSCDSALCSHTLSCLSFLHVLKYHATSAGRFFDLARHANVAHAPRLLLEQRHM